MVTSNFLLDSSLRGETGKVGREASFNAPGETVMSGLKVNRFIACAIAGSLLFSSSAAVASAPVASAPSAQQIDPWAALSALSGAAPAAALCGAAAAAAASMQPAAGCVLPVVDQAPPVISQAGPPP